MATYSYGIIIVVDVLFITVNSILNRPVMMAAVSSPLIYVIDLTNKE